MKKVAILIIITVILAILALFWNKNGETTQKSTGKTLKIAGKTLNVQIADTDAKRARGLSGKEGLTENEGMLFVFETEGYYGFWMKEMNFPIDIAWLDKDKKITYIEKNLSPETYPKVFYALKNNNPILNLYVLETKSGFFEKSGIEIGETAEF